MFRPRIIPVLLLQKSMLTKSVQFKNHKYIGDPLNAVRLYNDFMADEIVILDTDATREGRCIRPDLLSEVSEEANFPFGAGGGISTLAHIKQTISAGAEKVVIGAAAVLRPEFIREAADSFGKSTVCVCIDVKKNLFGKKKVVHTNASKKSEYEPLEFALLMQEMGAGEIVLQSVDYDGKMEGYDISLTRQIADALTIPLVALGGAGSRADLRAAVHEGHASAVASGSMFIYADKNRGVLINYPEDKKSLI